MEKNNPETVMIKDSRFGKGIFTTTDLPKNSFLFKITGAPLTFRDTLTMGADECYSIQVGLDKYLVPDYPFRMSNHSCEPNCGITRDLDFITLCDIKAGEELLWDYSTSMLEKHWEMKCDCGSANCRKTIRDFDLLPYNIKEKYLKMKVVLRFIIEELYGLPAIKKPSAAKIVSGK
ncbi:MAG: SET domain-containing protein-lysine N-methyltransferase [Ginsengibacter sp.]